jgi:hypothetical protein
MKKNIAEPNNNNELNETEAQLRSWSPRRPSPRIEQRLFAREPGASPLAGRFSFQWLAPATAVLMVLCMLFSERNNASPAGRASTKWMVATIMSNQSAAPYLPGSFTRDANILSANSFEWTNASRSPSSLGASSKGIN